MLKNKKILYIGAKFFDYEKSIKHELELLGAEVTFYDDRPSNGVLMKVLLRLDLKFLINWNINNYYDGILSKIENKTFDYLFIVNPEALNKFYLEKIIDLQPSAKSILYIWDAIFNKPNISKLLGYFDKAFTFDSNDSEKLKINFLPLFYIDKYKSIKKQENYKYDICFIGTAHSDRYKIIKEIKKQFGNEIKMRVFLYLPSKLMYWIRKIFIKKYDYGDVSEFSFSPLSQSEIINIFQNSRIVLDINHPLQFGLTSRTIETLGAKRKLITTNENIKKYDFYNENNITCINRSNVAIDKLFFSSLYEDIDRTQYEFYSLENWLKNIFKEEI